METLKQPENKSRQEAARCLRSELFLTVSRLLAVSFLVALAISYANKIILTYEVIFVLIFLFAAFIVGPCIICKLIAKATETAHKLSLLKQGENVNADWGKITVSKNMLHSAVSMILVAVVVCVFSYPYYIKVSSYNSGLQHIEQGDYLGALDELENAGAPYELTYKDSEQLYKYCQARLAYEQYNYIGAEIWADDIEFTYAKELNDDLEEFKDLTAEAKCRHEGQRKAFLNDTVPPKASPKPESVYPYPKDGISDGSDPYNTKDYDDFDTFYDNWYNDFIDYDEAEQYYDEHYWN